MRVIFTCLFLFTFPCVFAFASNAGIDQSQVRGEMVVHGEVVDLFSKKGLEGINISIKGLRSTSLQTDPSGRFTIEVPMSFVSLIISYPGYQTQEIPLDGRKNIKILLVPENVDAGESKVQLPYSVQYQKDLNGSYSIYAPSPDHLGQDNNVSNLLKGKFSGLESATFSGIPDEGALLNIRGVRSLFTTNQPLIVVDGFPLSDAISLSAIAKGNVYNYLSDLNVKDIESISILKDAAAVAFYGTHGANGVISVKTISGTTGKTFLDLNVQTTLGISPKDIPMLNGNEYTSYFQNKLFDQGYSQTDIKAKYPFLYTTNQESQDFWRYRNNTNWQDQLKQNSLSTDYHLGLRGGDGTSQYLFSIGYNNQNGQFTGLSSDRLSTRFNLDFKMLRTLSVGTRVSYTNTSKQLLDQGAITDNNPFWLSLVKPSSLSVTGKNNLGVDLASYEAGAYDGLNNPIAIAKMSMNNFKDNWLRVNIFVNVDFSAALKSKLNLGLDWRYEDSKRFMPKLGRIATVEGWERIAERQFEKYVRYWVEHTFSYDKTFNDEHQLSGVAGYNINLLAAKRDYGMTVDSPSDNFKGLNSGKKISVDGENYKIHSMALFANADYNFRKKYFLKAGIRADGSSRFDSGLDAGLKMLGTPFALSPYVGVAWRVSGEPFMQNISFINELKLRGSAGVSANTDIDPTLHMALYTAKYYSGFPGLVPQNIANRGIKWETYTNYNGGIDLTMFNKTVRVNLDYFHTQTDDMLIPLSLDGIFGISSVWVNNGSMQTKGVELGINYIGQIGKVQWNLGATFATAGNKINSLAENRSIVNNYYGYESIARVGSSAGLFYGYESKGVFATQQAADQANLVGPKGIKFMAGDYQYVDQNKDGRIDANDRVVIGDPNPDFYGGFSLGLTYRKFDFNTDFYYTFGNDILNITRARLESPDDYQNVPVSIGRAWQKEGDISLLAKPRYGDPLNNQRGSSNWVEDGSFLRMRSLSVGYTVDKALSFIRYARFFVRGYNLFTMTNYLGLDPDFRIGTSPFTRGYDFGNIPQSASIMLGIKLGL
ncbi:MAG: SusC/RagA family TonB-linked outer membrane protein [Prolixibacteraceae bacterium]